MWTHGTHGYGAPEAINSEKSKCDAYVGWTSLGFTQPFFISVIDL